MQGLKDKSLVNLHKIPCGDYTILHYDHNTWLDIPLVEEKYEAKYVGEFSIHGKLGWYDIPFSIFWTDKRHPEGSNWFGLFMTPDHTLRICNGLTAATATWQGVLDPETKEVLYSAFHHDYQKHNNLMADGGQEYLRASIGPVMAFKLVDKGGIEWQKPKNLI